MSISETLDSVSAFFFMYTQPGNDQVASDCTTVSDTGTQSMARWMDPDLSIVLTQRMIQDACAFSPDFGLFP